MAVRSEKNGAVWTIIHDRPEARNAMDPKSADALTQQNKALHDHGKPEGTSIPPARFEDLWRVDIDCIEHVSAVRTLGNGGCLLGGNV